MKLFTHDINKYTFDIAPCLYVTLYIEAMDFLYLLSLKKNVLCVTFLSICFSVCCCLFCNRLIASEFRMFRFICEVSKSILYFQLIFVCIKCANVGIKNEQLISNKMHEY